MTGPFSNLAFGTSFVAQAAFLTAVGLLIVPSTLVAYRIGGVSSCKVPDPLPVLKMVAYVVLAWRAEALLGGMPRKPVMVGLDLGRMLRLVPMAFAATTLQIAMLTSAFFVFAAAFTPLHQSVIPDLLPEKESLTSTLVWPRIAHALETVLRAAIAAALPGVIWAAQLFLAVVLAVVGLILALLATRFPARAFGDGTKPFLERAVIGLRIYCYTPRLRGLNSPEPRAVAGNGLGAGELDDFRRTVSGRCGEALSDPDGDLRAGRCVGAGLAPTMVIRMGERMTMMLGAFRFAALGPVILFPLTFASLLAFKASFGRTSSLVSTPGGLAVTHSAPQQDCPAAFAVRLSPSHAGWLWAYPLAGWLGTVAGLEPALIFFSGLAAAAAFAAPKALPADDPMQRTHGHPVPAKDHLHQRHIPACGPGYAHRHDIHIGDLHRRWVGSTA